MNRKFVSKSNYVLRKVLNSKENLDIIQDFIESILNLKIKKITLNKYLKNKERYLPQEENFGIADVRIETYENKELNVGIQIIDGYYVQNKLLLYYAQIHTNQLEHDENRIIADTITINILDFPYLPSKQYHKVIEIKESEDLASSKEKIRLHILELPKFKENPPLNKTKETCWLNYMVGNEINKKEKNVEKIIKLDKLLDKYWEEEKME